MLTPLTQFEGAIGSTAEITIDWNAFRTLWLPLLKGPLANLYKTKVLHTGENARAGDERVIVETLQNREARMNATDEDRTVIEEGVGIVDELAAKAGLPVLEPAQLTYQEQKNLLYHQHAIKKEEGDREEKRLVLEVKKRKYELDALTEQSHQETVRSRDARLLELLNAEKLKALRLEMKNGQLEKKNDKLDEKAERLQSKVDEMQSRLDAKDAKLRSIQYNLIYEQ